MVLQSDNGREFSGVAMTVKERRQVFLTPKFLDEVISELKNIWTFGIEWWSRAC